MRRLVLAIVLASAAAPAAADPTPAPMTERKVDPSEYANRPSGFWGSTRKSEGGAYRYRLLGIGIVLATITGLLMLRAVKRANAERAIRSRDA